MKERESDIREKRWISPEDLFAAVQDTVENGSKASFTVTGMSMWPLICHGRDQVVVEAVSPETICKGDIVLLHAGQSGYLLHRITKIENDKIQTTGDGNTFHDGFFSKDCIIARVVVIKHPEREIDCSKWNWKLYGRVWMALYPIRPLLFKFWSAARKYCR